MPAPPANSYPHILLRDTATPKPFTAHQAKSITKPAIPDLDRQQHGQMLQGQLKNLRQAAIEVARAQRDARLLGGIGLQVQFVGQLNVQLALQSLSQEAGKDGRNKIELMSVSKDHERTYANVFIPDGKLAHFEKYVAEYLAEKKDKNGVALDHKSLLNTIQEIRAAELRSLWMDDFDVFPSSPDELFWWEVWLPTRGHRHEVIADFRLLAQSTGCQVGTEEFHFPERTVLLLYGSERQLSASALTLNCVAELRRAKVTAAFFNNMGVESQREWQDNLLLRTKFADDEDSTPRICLLDTGVNRGHPLLSQVLQPQDMHTTDLTGLMDDVANHGTGMAGLMVYGDLTAALESDSQVEIGYRLESVRLIATEGANVGRAALHADLFSTSVAKPEISHPDRKRVFCTAVTASDYRDRGRPSSWSAAVDDLASGAAEEEGFSRLFILSAGNTVDSAALADYPASLSTNLIHDPGQAWNALTVGACTSKTDTGSFAYEAVAPQGALSPYTTTSSTWDGEWPLKPDIVLEGGNVGKNELGSIGMDSLELLTTSNKPLERMFINFNATSAASALCAKVAAEITSAYPTLRPETVRGLIVHSAEWTDAMREQYLQGASSKSAYVHLIRHCGWGQPDLKRALWSASNSLTLVIEDQLYPFKKPQGSQVVSHEMNLHELPWPRAELEALQDAPVKMRVTLSYFIEPNPSARGGTSKYYYPSHRLRFDMQRSLDATTDDFMARINAATERDDVSDSLSPADPDWYLGSRQRHRGSLHQDVWEGTAADLASRGFLAVYPAAGWWRTRPALGRYECPARYSLIVSIRTKQIEVDLYNAIAQQVVITT